MKNTVMEAVATTLLLQNGFPNRRVEPDLA